MILLARLAETVEGRVLGVAETEITGVSSIEEARPGDIVFAESERYFEAAVRSSAAAVICSEAMAQWAVEKPLLVVAEPRSAFSLVLALFQRPLPFPEGVHATALLDSSVAMGSDVCIGAYVTVGEGAVLGDGVILMDGCRVGARAQIGAGTILHPNAVIYPEVVVGKRCILYAGCVVGADGYGFVPVGRSLQRIPHLGKVRIGDDVEVGANTCIDRAKTGETVVGSGTKVDNLVHIAHNVHIGQSCLLIAQVGIAGSVSIGHGVVLGGQVGVADHLTIGDGARVGAQGGVTKSVLPGQTVSGYPARPHAEKMRELAALSALPDALKKLRNLEKRLAELERSQADNSATSAILNVEENDG